MGFFYLYSKHKNFPITSQMIGLNNQGKIKVWLNKNFSENHPEDPSLRLYVSKNIAPEDQSFQREKSMANEKKMIKEIFEIINQKHSKNQDSF